MNTNGSSTGGWRGLAAGAAGGLVGSSAMVIANHLLAAAGLGREDPGRHHRERRVDAKPNDADGSISDEPATRKAASRNGPAHTRQRGMRHRWRRTSSSGRRSTRCGV